MVDAAAIISDLRFIDVGSLLAVLKTCPVKTNDFNKNPACHVLSDVIFRNLSSDTDCETLAVLAELVAWAREHKLDLKVSFYVAGHLEAELRRKTKQIGLVVEKVFVNQGACILVCI